MISILIGDEIWINQEIERENVIVPEIGTETEIGIEKRIGIGKEIVGEVVILLDPVQDLVHVAILVDHQDLVHHVLGLVQGHGIVVQKGGGPTVETEVIIMNLGDLSIVADVDPEVMRNEEDLEVMKDEEDLALEVLKILLDGDPQEIKSGKLFFLFF